MTTGTLQGVPSPIQRLLDPQDGEPSSILLSTRLQSFRSGLAEPYFKSRQAAGAKTRPGDAAELVQLRKQAAAMSRDFGKLLGTHERTEAAVVDLRQKVRALRQELDAREKALELARRTVERLSGEKGQLEADAAGVKMYVRKLEGRLLAVRHAAELEQACAQLKAQLDQQAHALHEAEQRAATAEEGRQQALLDVACLKRGLELAAEQLTRSAGAEVPGTLLRAVARGQEEALGLSLQLSDAKQQVGQLAAALEQARQHLEAQQTALTQHQGERQELLQRAEAAEAALEKQRAKTAELRRVLDAVRPKAGALAEERSSLLQQLELERTAAAEAQQAAKQLRAALKHKGVVEAALRDELRRALAGEGASPSPLPAKLPGSARRGAAASPAVLPPRPGSRAGSSLRQGAGVAALPGKRPGSAGAGAAKAVSRQASAWEQQQQQQQPSTEQALRGSDTARHAAARGGLIAAEPSPTRALSRLQEQRRQQQGSRRGAQPPQHEAQPASWEEVVAGWQLQQGSPPASGSAAGGEQLSPPSSCGDAARQQRPPKLALQAAAAGKAAEVLPVQDGRLMQLYASALDEQIALLESDLAQLADAPSPVAQLQKRAAKAGGGLGSKPAQQAQRGTDADSAPDGISKQQQEQAVPGGDIAAWRPNNAFAAEPAPAAAASAAPGSPARGMQQLLSPGGGTPAPAGAESGLDGTAADAPVPPIWHHNPLAGSPPKQWTALQLPTQPPQQQTPPRPAAPAGDGAVTVRALPSPDKAAWQALLGAGPEPAADGHSQHQAQGEAGAEWQGRASGASSPSLRLPASEASSGRQQAASEQQELIVLRAQQPHPTLQLPADSKGSNGVPSLSQHWSLPSPGPGNSDWLSNEFEADIEQLEVNSSQTPLRKQQAAVAAAAAREDEQPLQLEQPGRSPPNGGASSTGSEPAVLPSRIPQPPQHSTQRSQRTRPLLPGLPLLSDSPQQGVSGPAAPALAPTPEPSQPPQERPLHSLFDLAALDDLSDLISS